ncbi:hypothetical protein VU10_03760 [Desulfobulbus sp. US1]|nr:hypothetical protein [Desulfobulbus sp. US4]MCW5209304.1 hypothetical protein [Desulfobulbus sp. US1]WLE97107.1 MAG: hypothetical protein QTN59_20835 [Candidatus Electrothrix communis]
MNKVFFLLAGLVLLLGSTAVAGDISVEVVADQGYVFPAYPVSASPGNYRAYVQAKHNARYGLRIRNHTDRRVGLVVAVDGRNIISGKKSYLRNTERMYVLEPYGVAVYRGWRTGRDEVHRFYFTESSDSYAEAWGDQSAMGVIAVVAFAEKRQQIRRPSPQPRVYSAPSRARESSAADSAPGTGYGEGEHSSSVRVEFRPEPYALEKHFYKYEWRETLCRKRIISCSRPMPPQPPRNRFWHDDGYAPPPPRY